MPRNRIRDMLSGVLAAAVALGVAELVAAVLGTTSLVVAVGDYVVDHSPGDLTKAVIDALGTKDKPALLLGIVVSSLGVGALLGPAAGRRFGAGIAGFAIFGVVGAFAGARLPQGDAAASAVVAIAAAASGTYSLRLLLAAGRTDAIDEIEMPSEGSRGGLRSRWAAGDRPACRHRSGARCRRTADCGDASGAGTILGFCRHDLRTVGSGDARTTG